MQLIKNFLEFEGGLYEIVRSINESHKPIVETWKEHLSCEKVFKKDGIYHFCREVKDADVIE